MIWLQKVGVLIIIGGGAFIRDCITHRNISVILLVNTTSRDLKYYAYIPNIRRKGKKVPIKNGYIPHFEGYIQYFPDIAQDYFDYVIITISKNNF